MTATKLSQAIISSNSSASTNSILIIDSKSININVLGEKESFHKTRPDPCGLKLLKRYFELCHQYVN